MAGPFVIGVISQKGGVGKTTIAVNLAVALRLQNYRVLLVDGDTSNPSVGLALGMEDANLGYKDLISRKAKLQRLVSVHGASGLHVILGTLHTKPFVPNKAQLERLRSQLRSSAYDFVVIDTSPGYYTEDVFKHWNEGIVVATPDMPAITSVLRLEQLFKRTKTRCALVLNMVKGKRYELRADEIQDAWGGKIAAVLPDDDAVDASVAERIPVLLTEKASRFSKSIKSLSGRYTRGRGLSRIFKI